MASTSSLGFVALPGGFGTLEECAQMATWTQLGIHKKPVVLLNVNGFYRCLHTFVRGAVSSGFINQSNEGLMVLVDAPAPEESEGFNWGEAALQAVAEWHNHKTGTGGVIQYSLDWGNP